MREFEKGPDWRPADPNPKAQGEYDVLIQAEGWGYKDEAKGEEEPLFGRQVAGKFGVTKVNPRFRSGEVPGQPR